jgi:hypothetical protein
MARGTQLGQLVVQLRHEIGDSVSVAAGQDLEDSYKHILRRTQEELYEDYTWPHLVAFKSKALAAGQRYYDFPAGMNYEGIREAAVVYNGNPHDVERGIGFEHYASHSSDDDERSDPLIAWDIRDVAGAVQFEAWPIPASNSMTLFFKTVVALPALTSSSDTCVIDDRLIVLFAAAEILARRDSADARDKHAKAQGRLVKLRARSQGASKMITMGGASQPRRGLRGQTIIRVS